MSPKKSLGQHFLNKTGIIHRILRALDLKAEDRVLEIGPGRGALTMPLSEQCAQLVLVEKDLELAEWLREKLANRPVELIEGDFLEIDWKNLESRLGPKFKVVSNLPYNVGTAILVKLLREIPAGTSMVLMFQKEVGERISAKPGTKAYGSLSIFAQLLAEQKVVCAVPPSAFRPPPKVESLVLAFRKRETPLLPEQDWAAFEVLIHAGFAQRRKMLRQNLRPVLGGIEAGEVEARLKAVGAKPLARAEELSVEQWVALFKARSEPPRR